MTAFAQGEAVDLAIASGLETAQGRRGLSGALARTDTAVIGPHVLPWLQSDEPGLQLLGLIALSHHRRDPGEALAQHLADPDPAVRSRAARLAFELGRADLAGQLAEIADGSDLWPALALARSGKGATRLYDIAALPGHPQAARALDAALIAAPDLARDRLGAMTRKPDTRQLALSRAGVTEDQSIGGWLWQRQEEAADAEAARFALFDLFPLDPDLCSELGDAASRPPTVDAWLTAHSADTPHLSLRRQSLDAMRAAFRDRRAPLADWRKTRTFPAWS